MSLLPTAAAITERLPRALRRHKAMRAWMRLTGEDPLQLVTVRPGARAYADMADGFLRLIPIEGGYDGDFFVVGDAFMAGGGTFLDVGANFGLLSFGLEARFPGRIDFHLFEPNPALVAAIARSRALYPAMRCTVTQAAVADAPGALRFSIAEGQSGASHISTAGEASGIEVPAITLDGYLAESGIVQVDLLKLDVEGFELTALQGAAASLASRRIGAVYFEYFEKYLVRVGPPQDLIDFLAAQGFITCFCRACDFHGRAAPSHTVIAGQAGHGLPLLPVAGHSRPPMTDLIAIPAEHLVALA